MKVCIPTIGNKGLDDTINDHFGRSPFYMVIDIDTNEVNFITQEENKTHGSCSPVDLILKSGADALICKGMGRKAINYFSEANVEVYISDTGSVKESIEKLKNGTLSKMNINDGCAGHHH